MKNSYQMKKKRYRWSAKRFLKNFAILFTVAMLGTLLVSPAAKAMFDKPAAKTGVIPVWRGDTLWSIARQIAPKTDPRQTIGKLKIQNHLKASNLIAGQQLRFTLEP